MLVTSAMTNLLPAFCPFPTMFSKGPIYKVVKGRDCVVELMALVGVSMAEMSDRVAQSVEQDWTTCILVYTFQKINAWS